MADISKNQTHSMDVEVLRPRLRDLADEMTKKFGIKAEWDGDTCHLSGNFLKSGTLKLTPNDVSVELTLGMMAKMLKGQIEKEIESRVQKLFA
ncbi:MAG: polyhydroxyalkanoic acid system family protein [Myxococcota bacterium]|nr:polyhydroxyalkanoic acid system family protein [Myxococcota bacterium]